MNAFIGSLGFPKWVWNSSSLCSICCDEFDYDSFHRMPCRKKICHDCMNTWISTQLSGTMLQSIEFKCPFCSELLSDIQLKTYVNKELMDKIEAMKVKVFLIEQQDFHFCPKCTGGGWLQTDFNEVRK